PNALTFPLIAAGIGQAYLLNLPLKDHIIGAAIGYLAFVAIEQGFRKLRGYPGLGRGDAKLLAAGGAWVGWWGLPYIVLLASLTGLSVMFAGLLSGRLKTQDTKKLAIPFGPFLSLAIAMTWAVLIFWPRAPF
ncbi:MAG: A24 family peptidase, partial [Marinomonas sp.]